MLTRAAIDAAKGLGTSHSRKTGLLRSEWIRLGYAEDLYPYYVTALNGIGYRGRRYE